MVGNACPIARKDGSPCGGTPTKSGYCLAHDPALAEKRTAARRKGGKGKSRLVRAQKLIPEDLQAMDRVLSRCVADVYRGIIAPAQGTAIASMVGARVRIREIALKMREQTELTERIEKLEEQIVKSGISTPKNGKGSGFPAHR
jgi:hypothetical protein